MPEPTEDGDVSALLEYIRRTRRFDFTPEEPPMAEAYIIDAVRTPVGKRGGGLSQVHPADLGALRWVLAPNDSGSEIQAAANKYMNNIRFVVVGNPYPRGALSSRAGYRA